MNYPLISEYVEAIKSAAYNFATLTHLRPVLNEDGSPVMTSGNFAVVFKMKDEESGKYYAVKCFLKDQPNRAESYKMIADELEYVSSTFLVQFRYLDKELFVDTNNSDEEEFPVLVMDWVEGATLDKYIRQNIDDQYVLQMLAYQFSKLTMWIIPQPFAHGDIKPDNVMVREDGSLVLIDYDGMYVPAMKGQKARELGSPDFRHPSRTEDDFDEHIDDFSLISILLSLRAIANDASLLERYGATDRLLFSEKDYLDINSCKLLKELYPSTDKEINTLVSLFTIALTQGNLSKVSFRLMALTRPEEPEILSTEVTDEDLANAWTDEYGVKYSKDGTKVIECTKDLDKLDYFIKDGVIVICDGAFQMKKLNSIHLPNSVKAIGGVAFANNDDLEFCNIPNSVTYIKDNNPWGGCFRIKKMDCSSTKYTIDDGILYSSNYRIAYGLIYWHSNLNININIKTRIIAGNAFWSDYGNCRSITKVNIGHVVTIGKKAFAGCRNFQQITIPNSVTNIGNSAFSWCESLQQITIPESVTSIGNSAFWGCDSLQQVTIPNSVTSIGEEAFYGCKSLQQITIPNSVTNIGNSAFSWCESLQQITIPESVTSIGNSAFSLCDSLQQITIPNSVTRIGEEAFSICKSLQQITIPNSVTNIGKGAFSYCEKLVSLQVDSKNKIFDSRNSCNAIIETQSNTLVAGCSLTNIPNSVTNIGDSAFRGCKSLQQITIPDSVTRIGNWAFSWCESLQQITIPNSATNIGDSAFRGCKSLQQITIPNSVTRIGYCAFEGCKSLHQITIPNSVTSIGYSAFYECKSLQQITIPNSATNIGEWAFYGCYSLQQIIISHKTYNRLKDSLLGYGTKIKFID